MNTDERFGGIARLYGLDGLARLQAALVAVVGIGGVGSWAAEALARSGVGEISLFDLDDVCEVVRGLCDLIDATSPERPFDWRVPQVYSTSLAMMLKLDRQAPARAAVKAHLDRLIASKMV